MTGTECEHKEGGGEGGTAGADYLVRTRACPESLVACLQAVAVAFGARYTRARTRAHMHTHSRASPLPPYLLISLPPNAIALEERCLPELAAGKGALQLSCRDSGMTLDRFKRKY
eukprot:7508093-Pyramimonas_sp.AAC.2